MRRSDREVKERKGIEDIILRCKTCHVAMADGGLPYVVPLSFGYGFINDCTLELYFHSATEGKKLEILKRNNRVCFEISDEGTPVSAETPCDSGYYFSSVIGYGEVVFMEDASEKCEGLSIIVRHQTGKSVNFDSSQVKNVCVYKIVSTEFSGKQKPVPASDEE